MTVSTPGAAPMPRPVTCPTKGRNNLPTEGEIKLSVTATRRSPDAIMRRMIRASQILLTGYERLGQITTSQEQEVAS